MNRSDQQWTLSQIKQHILDNDQLDQQWTRDHVREQLDLHTHTHQSHVASHATGQITRLQSPRLMGGYPRTFGDVWTCVWTLRPEHNHNWRQDEHVIGLGNWAYDQHARTTISAPSLNQRGGPDTDHFVDNPDDRLVNHVDRFTRHDQQLCWLDQHTLDHTQSAQHVTHQVKQRRVGRVGRVVAVSCTERGTIRSHGYETPSRMYTRYYVQFLDGVIMGFDSHHLNRAFDLRHPGEPLKHQS